MHKEETATPVSGDGSIKAEPPPIKEEPDSDDTNGTGAKKLRMSQHNGQREGATITLF